MNVVGVRHVSVLLTCWVHVRGFGLDAGNDDFFQSLDTIMGPDFGVGTGNVYDWNGMGVVAEEKEECKDDNEFCWMSVNNDRKVCENNDWLLKNCKRSCGLCGDDELHNEHDDYDEYDQSEEDPVDVCAHGGCGPKFNDCSCPTKDEPYCHEGYGECAKWSDYAEHLPGDKYDYKSPWHGLPFVRGEFGQTVVAGEAFYPEVMFEGKYYPICGYWFWDTNDGADTVCEELGFVSGFITHTHTAFAKHAMPVGRCGAGQKLDECTRGGNAWGNFDYKLGYCKRGKKIGASVTCQDGTEIEVVEDDNGLKRNDEENDHFPGGMWHWSWTERACSGSNLDMGWIESPFVCARTCNPISNRMLIGRTGGDWGAAETTCYEEKNWEGSLRSNCHCLCQLDARESEDCPGDVIDKPGYQSWIASPYNKAVKGSNGSIPSEEERLALLGVKLIAERKECSGGEHYVGERFSVLHCRNACIGHSTMFVFGTNDFGAGKCLKPPYSCDCFCETSATEDGHCDQIEHNGYRLYQII